MFVACSTDHILPGLAVTVQALYLGRPLPAEAASQPIDIWTLGIRKLQDLLYSLYARPQSAKVIMQDDVQLWVQVHLERMLCVPSVSMPRNGPRIVMNLLEHLTGVLFHGNTTLADLYRPVIVRLYRLALGPRAVVLDDADYHPSPPDPMSVHRLFDARPDIGHHLHCVVSTGSLQAAEALLQHLAEVAVPADRAHGWVEDVPWDQVVDIVMRHVPLPSANMLLRVEFIQQLLNPNR